MSSEEYFDDQPLTDVDEHAVAKALSSQQVFERSTSTPAATVPSMVSSTDEFPDEPEPETEPMPEPQPLDAEVVDPSNADASTDMENPAEHHSSYGHSDPASLAAAGSGHLHDAQLGAVHTHELAHAELASPASDQALVGEAEPSPELPPELAMQPHLAHLAQVGLTDSDTWDEQIKPRIEHLHEQIEEVNVRLDHLTTRKHR